MNRFRLTILASALGVIGISTARGPSDATAGPVCPGPRFTIANGWVLDAVTKLKWQQAFLLNRTWAQAKADCTSLGSGARLPSVTEIQTIVDDTKHAPAIDSVAFPGTPEDGFWTSSMTSGIGGTGWAVRFTYGTTQQFDLTDPAAVRCVR